jgi:N-acetylglucosamine kinase-like BadF-type ATPase
MQVAAVDGGGTKTAAALADREGRVTLLPVGGGCNPQDNPAWAEALGPVLAALGTPVAAVVGLPGWGEVPALDRVVGDFVAARLPGAVILNDVDLAARGAFPDADGVLILAGTGSMAMARGVRVGGWGDMIGDEGSAFRIGQRALTEMARVIDGRSDAWSFARALGGRLGCGVEGFAPLDWVMGQPHGRSAIAGVAREVDALAEAGDALARAMLAVAGQELVELGRVAAARAGLAAPDWAAAGSVFRSRVVTDTVAEGMGREAVPPRFSALGGGLWAAAKAAGWDVGAAWGARVAAAT